MEQPDAFALGRSDLNGFLFADIGVEGSGMPLSVISALARQGLDPWQEAGRLAQLPRAAATDGLARLIAAMPASLWPMPDATKIAARLVALLPGHVSHFTVSTPVSATSVASNGGSSEIVASKARERQSGTWQILVVLLMALLVGVVGYAAFAPPAPATPPPAAAAPLNSVPAGD